MVLIAAVMLIYYLNRPEHLPAISNYTQLTHDGEQKFLTATDGSRIYLGVGPYQILWNRADARFGGDPVRIEVPLPNTPPSGVITERATTCLLSNTSPTPLSFQAGCGGFPSWVVLHDESGLSWPRCDLVSRWFEGRVLQP